MTTINPAPVEAKEGFKESPKSYAKRAIDSLKTGLGTLMEGAFSADESVRKNSVFEVEKKIQESLEHLGKILEIE